MQRIQTQEGDKQVCLMYKTESVQTVSGKNNRAADVGEWVGVKLGFSEINSVLLEVNSSKSLKAEAVCRVLHVLQDSGSALPPLRRF